MRAAINQGSAGRHRSPGAQGPPDPQGGPAALLRIVAAALSCGMAAQCWPGEGVQCLPIKVITLPPETASLSASCSFPIPFLRARPQGSGFTPALSLQPFVNYASQAAAGNDARCSHTVAVAVAVAGTDTGQCRVARWPRTKGGQNKRPPSGGQAGRWGKVAGRPVWAWQPEVGADIHYHNSQQLKTFMWLPPEPSPADSPASPPSRIRGRSCRSAGWG